MKETLTVVQANIFYQASWREVARDLRQFNADIICAQELTTNSRFNRGVHVAEKLAEDLKLNVFYHEAQHWMEEGYPTHQGNAIFSKYPIVGRRIIFIREPKELTERNPEAEGRVNVGVVVNVNGMNLSVDTDHLTYTPRFEDTEEKERQVDKTVEIFSRVKRRGIRTLDANTPPESKLLERLLTLPNLKHVGPDIRQPTWPTKNFSFSDYHVKPPPSLRLDYAFVTPDFQVIRSEIVQVKSSDHCYIVFELAKVS